MKSAISVSTDKEAGAESWEPTQGQTASQGAGLSTWACPEGPQRDEGMSPRAIPAHAWNAVGLLGKRVLSWMHAGGAALV